MNLKIILDHKINVIFIIIMSRFEFWRWVCDTQIWITVSYYRNKVHPLLILHCLFFILLRQNNKNKNDYFEKGYLRHKTFIKSLNKFCLMHWSWLNNQHLFLNSWRKIQCILEGIILCSLSKTLFYVIQLMKLACQITNCGISLHCKSSQMYFERTFIYFNLKCLTNTPITLLHQNKLL